MILGDRARPVFAGIAIGIGTTWFATSLLEKMLWVEATDVLSFTMLLLTIGLLASWIPAMRATHIAPTEALQRRRCKGQNRLSKDERRMAEVVRRRIHPQSHT